MLVGFLAALLMGCGVAPALAHHGFGVHFDPSAPVRIEGTVQRFDFVNPHALLLVETVNENWGFAFDAFGYERIEPGESPR